MGRTWFHPASNGLRCPGFNSVAIDPRDHNILLALGNMVWWGTNNAKQQARCGVWRSTDFGATWSWRSRRWTTPGGDDFNQSLFAYAPASRSAPPAARVWFTMQSIRPQGQERLGAQLWRSADGGATWAKVGAADRRDHLQRDVPAGRPSGDREPALPRDAERPLGDRRRRRRPGPRPAAGCRARSAAASRSRRTAARSTPRSRARPRPRTASGARANGGTSWTRVYDAQPVKRLAVDWKSSPETIYVQLDQGSGPDMVVAKGPSGPWTKPPVTPMLGYEYDAYHQRLSTSSRYDGLIVPQAGACVVNAVGRIFRSDDGGRELPRLRASATPASTSRRS